MTGHSSRKSSRGARFLALLLLVATSGCAGTTAQRGMGWIEVRSSNFSIYTALAEREGRALLENLELFRATILAVTKARTVEPNVPTEIYAFRSEGDFRPFEPRPDAVGFFRPTLRANYVALSSGSRAARATLYHEYTHFLLQNEGAAHHPLWFDEGFAELLSSIDVRGNNVRIGDPPPQRVGWLRSGSSIPWARVIRARSYDGFNEDELQMFYAQSWLLVHHLMLRKDADFPTQMQQYIQRIERRVEPEEAFQESFGIAVDELPERLKKYRKKLPVFGIPRDRLSPELAVEVRAVPPDEIDTRLGWLALTGGRIDLARQHFERATTANANNARAIAGTSEVNKLGQRWEEAEAGYRRAIELAPNDYQNQLEIAEYWLARAHKEGDERPARIARTREHLARSIELAPRIPEGHAVLGSTYLIVDEPVEPGIAALERAQELLPANAEVEYQLARLYLRVGDRERAIDLLRRVVYQPHSNAPTQAAVILQQLESESPGS
jgi:tetratricopeptide (TPR) repeat protein